MLCCHVFKLQQFCLEGQAGGGVPRRHSDLPQNGQNLPHTAVPSLQRHMHCLQMPRKGSCPSTTSKHAEWQARHGPAGHLSAHHNPARMTRVSTALGGMVVPCAWQACLQTHGACCQTGVGYSHGQPHANTWHWSWPGMHQQSSLHATECTAYPPSWVLVSGA